MGWSVGKSMPQRFSCEWAGARHLCRFTVAIAIRPDFFEVAIYLGIEAA
jgi:hypothetical protein